MQIPPELQIVEKGPSLGQYRGRDIPEWLLTATGVKSIFQRIAKEDADGGCPLSQLGQGESVVAPGLIYRDQ